jgi:phage terminase small subunit
MNTKRKLFVAEYLKDHNATAAYKRAGYKSKNDNVAAVSALQLLRNPQISAAVSEATAKQIERVEVTADWILLRLKQNAERALAADLKFGGVANRALELLGKHIGLFPDKVELTGKDGAPVQNELTVREEMAPYADVFRDVESHRNGFAPAEGLPPNGPP